MPITRQPVFRVSAKNNPNQFVQDLYGGGGVTISVSNESVSIIGGGGGGAAGTNTISAAGTAISGTALSLAIAAGANITLNTATGAGSITISIVGPTVPAATNFSLNGTSSSVSLIAGAGITLNSGASSITIVGNTTAASGSLYISATSAAGGSTAGTVTSALIGSTISLVAGNNVLLSQGSNAAITISVPTPAASGILYVSASSAAGGATLGTVTSAPINSTLSLFAGSNITLSQGSNDAITIIGAGGAAGTQTFAASGTSVTGTALSVSLVAGNNIRLSTATGAGSMTVTINQAATNSFALLTGALGVGSLAIGGVALVQSQVMWPYEAKNNISAASVAAYLKMSIQTSAAASSGTGSMSFSVGIFTRNVSTLSTASSASTLITFSWSSTGGTTTNAISGTKMITIPLAINMTPGDYWIGYQGLTASGGQLSFAVSSQCLIQPFGANAFSGMFGLGAATSGQIVPGMGFVTVSSTNFLSSMPFNSIQGTAAASQVQVLLYAFNSTF